MRKSQTTLEKYEVIATGEIYYGYHLKEAMTKDIDGVKYVELTNSLSRPKQFFLRADSLKHIGHITFDTPKRG